MVKMVFKVMASLVYLAAWFTVGYFTYDTVSDYVRSTHGSYYALLLWLAAMYVIVFNLVKDGSITVKLIKK